MDRGVCPVCLDEDTEEGRDHRNCGKVVSVAGFSATRPSRTSSRRYGVPRRHCQGEPELDLMRWLEASSGHRLRMATYITSLGLPLSYGQRPSASTNIASLKKLSPAWRAVTIVAIADLLFGMGSETKRLPSSARTAFRRFELEPTVPDAHAPLPAQLTSHLKLRPEPEYGKLASDMIHSQAWKSLPQKSGRERNRAIGRLMLRALNDG